MRIHRTYRLGLALAVIFAVACEFPNHREARLGAIRRLAQIRASVPQFEVDTLTVAVGPTLLHLRGWFDGPQLVVLREEEQRASTDWSHNRFYFDRGRLFACTTTFIGPPGRVPPILFEGTALFDTAGRPIAWTTTVDGKPRGTNPYASESFREAAEGLAGKARAAMLLHRLDAPRARQSSRHIRRSRRIHSTHEAGPEEPGS